MRRSFIILLILGAIAALAIAIHKYTLSKREDALIVVAHSAIREHRLTELGDECLVYLARDSDDDAFIVDVFESREKPACGGERGTAHRLFGIKISHLYRPVGTDAEAVDGTYKDFSR